MGLRYMEKESPVLRNIFRALDQTETVPERHAQLQELINGLFCFFSFVLV
jgi:hypothetical protein